MCETRLCVEVNHADLSWYYRLLEGRHSYMYMSLACLIVCPLYWVDYNQRSRPPYRAREFVASDHDFDHVYILRICIPFFPTSITVRV